MENLTVFLFLLSLAAFVIALVKPSILRTTKKKGVILSIIAMLVTFTITGAIAPKTKAEDESVSRVLNSPKTTPIPTKPKITAKPLTTEERVKAIVSGKKGYQASFSDNIATFKNSPNEMWDENSIVRLGFTDLVTLGKQAFKINGVNEVIIEEDSSFTDSYGKNSNERAVGIGMDKDSFNKFNWDNLKYQPVLSNIQSNSVFFYVHPAIAKNLDPNKLYLTF